MTQASLSTRVLQLASQELTTDELRTAEKVFRILRQAAEQEAHDDLERARRAREATYA